MRLRVKWKGGQATLTLVDTATISDLQTEIASACQITVARQRVLCGFPPRCIEISDASAALTAAGIRSGDTLTVEELPPPAALSPEYEAGSRVTLDRGRGSAVVITVHSEDAANGFFYTVRLDCTHQEVQTTASHMSSWQTPDHAEGVQQLVALGFSPETASGALSSTSGDVNAAAQLLLDGGGAVAAPAAAAAPLPPQNDAPFIRRVVAADNSCLFTAVQYLTAAPPERRRHRPSADALRATVSSVVRSSPGEFGADVLGREPDDYCRWIEDATSWGGEIELLVLSRNLRVQLVAVDIRTLHVYRYGEEFARWGCLLFDGAHYDPLVQPDGEAPDDEFRDKTTFEAPPDESAALLERAMAVARKAQRARQFYDASGGSLRCGVCQLALKGEKEAKEHATATGHTNFVSL